jgi:hypothetical protein
MMQTCSGLILDLASGIIESDGVTIYRVNSIRPFSRFWLADDPNWQRNQEATG